MSETNVDKKVVKNQSEESTKKFDVGSWLIPIVAVLVAMAIAAILIKLQGLNPITAYKSLFKTAFGSIEGLGVTLGKSTPLVLSGLAVAVGLRAGLFNIGAQGQFIAGAIGASWVGFTFDLPTGIHAVAAIAAAMLFAGLYGGFVGLLKARTGAHEVIVTIMLNYVAGYFLLWLLSTTAFLRPGRQDPLAPEVKMSARLRHLFGSELRANLGFIVALVAAAAIWWLLNRSTWGFRFRAVGANAAASRTAGISVARVTTSVMFIAGALAGLGGAVQILGSEPAMTAGVGGSFGFDAITVALLGRATPIGTVFAALLFGALRAGGLTMQASTETPLDLVLVIQALVVLFIAAPALIKSLFRLKNVDEGETVASKGWNG